MCTHKRWVWNPESHVVLMRQVKNGRGWGFSPRVYDAPRSGLSMWHVPLPSQPSSQQPYDGDIITIPSYKRRCTNREAALRMPHRWWQRPHWNSSRGLQSLHTWLACASELQVEKWVLPYCRHAEQAAQSPWSSICSPTPRKTFTT